LTTGIDEPNEHQVGRRHVLAVGGAVAVAAGTGAAIGPAPAAEAVAPDESAAPRPAPDVVGPGEAAVTLRVNGTDRAVQVEPRVTLLDVLRERLGLTGTKKGCDRGECGACTVLIDGRRAKSCLTLAIMQSGTEITTIEGLARGGRLHPMQAAFIERDAFQCGFCTSGQIMSAVGMLDEGRPGSDAEIRERMSGNLCRCSAYPNIVAAIRDVAGGRG
jgi:xanthine dehydrogenase YagT iron-sulfur-binding subunit